MNPSAEDNACITCGAAPILHVTSGSKKYNGTLVLHDVDFDVCAGEVHALLGENGAGKSTLAKIVAGAVSLDSGTLTLHGKERCFRSPADALSAGVAMVYQETSLIPTMTVAQNLQLGHESWIIRSRLINNAAQRALQSVGFDVDPRAFVEHLGPAQRQMVEIARALQFHARVIVFDEPTASLSPTERQRFFDLVSTLRLRGVGVVFITHALEEALRVSDRITVLRDGKRAACARTAELDEPALLRLMVGRDLLNTRYAMRDVTRGEKVLSVENVALGTTVQNMSFSLYAGEVVGLTGPVGSGRSEIAKIVAGIVKRDRVHGGMICLRGKPVSYRTPAQAIRDGIVYITEDRKFDGFFETMTADDNIYLGSLATHRGWRFLYSRSRRKRIADYWVEKLSIPARNRSLRISEYSGGNQQKVVLARALAQEPSIIFFDEPTHGVDAGIIPQIYETIRDLVRQGKAVVVISSHPPEILSICDRVLIVRAGRIVKELEAATATEDQIMCAAAL